MISIVIFEVGWVAPRYKLLDRFRVSFLLPGCSKGISEFTEFPAFLGPRDQQLVADISSSAGTNIQDHGVGAACLDGVNFHLVRAGQNSAFCELRLSDSNNAEFCLLSF